MAADELPKLGVETWEYWFLGATFLLSAFSGAAGKLVRQRGEFVFEGMAMFSLVISAMTLVGILSIEHEFVGSNEDLTPAFIQSVGFDLILGTVGIAIGRAAGGKFAARWHGSEVTQSQRKRQSKLCSTSLTRGSVELRNAVEIDGQQQFRP